MLPSSGLFFLFIFYYSFVLAVERLLCLQKYSVLWKITLWFVFTSGEEEKKCVFIYNIFFWPSFVKTDFAFYHFNGFPSSCSIKLITEHSPLSFVSVCEGVIVIIITESRYNTGLYIMSYNILYNIIMVIVIAADLSHRCRWDYIIPLQ